MSRILIQGAVLLGRVEVAERLADRMRGLLGRDGLPPDGGLLIRPCRSIHMWGMRFPIDAAFLDAEIRVIKIARNLRPWRIALAPRRTRCVLEAAAGALDAVKTGDRLELA